MNKKPNILKLVLTIIITIIVTIVLGAIIIRATIREAIADTTTTTHRVDVTFEERMDYLPMEVATSSYVTSDGENYNPGADTGLATGSDWIYRSPLYYDFGDTPESLRHHLGLFENYRPRQEILNLGRVLGLQRGFLF